jgi:hypothetical protein
VTGEKPMKETHLNSEAILGKLTEAVRSAHNRITGVERDILKEKTQACLEALGYDVRIKSKTSGVLVRGVKQDLSIAACIDKSGTLSIDMAGFEGGACNKELDQLTGRLSESGVVMDDLRGIHHGKKEGGVLSQEAAREITFNPLNKNNRRHLFALSRTRRMIGR